MCAIYRGLTQVPTRRGEVSLRNAANTDSAVIRPVRRPLRGNILDRQGEASPEGIRPSAAAVPASNLGSAPLGTMISPFRVLRVRSGGAAAAARRPRAPSLVFRPATSAGKFVRALMPMRIRLKDRHTPERLWAVTQASVNHGISAESLRASTRPMAARPATPTRVVETTGLGTRRPPRSLLYAASCPTRSNGAPRQSAT